MAAQIKDYDNGDNAAVFKGKVNQGTPALREKVNLGTPALRENVSPETTALRRKVNTGTPALRGNVNPGTPVFRGEVDSRAARQIKAQNMRSELAAKKKNGEIQNNTNSTSSGPYGPVRIADNLVRTTVGLAGEGIKNIKDDVSKDISNALFSPGTLKDINNVHGSTLGNENGPPNSTFDPGIFKPTYGVPKKPVNGPGNGTTNTVPSKLIGAQQEAGTSRFDKSKLTLGNNPYTGQVGMFKNGEMISNQDAATALGQKGKGQFLGKFSAPVGGVTDFTNLFSQDQKLFQAQMAAVNRGEGSGIFTGPADPGAGRYGQGSQISALQSRRDMLQSKIDLYNKNNPITKGSSVGDIISNTVATQQMRDEIKNIDDTIFGKNDLANKIQQEIIRMQSGENEQNLRNKGAAESQHIAGNYGLMQQELQNKGAANTARIGASADFIKNMLGGKPAEFGKTKKDFVYKNVIELQKDQAKALYNSQIEAGKSHEEATSLIKASFPELQSPIDDDEKKVEGI